MKPELHTKPLIAFGWLRVLLLLAVYLCCILLAGAVVALLLKQSSGSSTGSASFVYLSVIVNMLITFALVGLFRKFIDRRTFSSLGFSLNNSGMHAGTGFFLGIFLMSTGACILYFSRHLQWTGISFNGRDLFLGFGLMVIVAFYEEVLVRGYILNNLMDSLGKWPALIIAALVFALLHTANPDFSLPGAVNVFLAGLLLGINYIYTKNLWYAILLHFSWNFFQGPVLGFEVSGVQLQSLLQHDLQGTELITGGKFGFEGSVVATLLLALATGAMAWIYSRKFAPIAAENTPAGKLAA